MGVLVFFLLLPSTLYMCPISFIASPVIITIVIDLQLSNVIVYLSLYLICLYTVSILVPVHVHETDSSLVEKEPAVVVGKEIGLPYNVNHQLHVDFKLEVHHIHCTLHIHSHPLLGLTPRVVGGAEGIRDYRGGSSRQCTGAEESSRIQQQDPH
jgi:hypothetical protein